METSITKQQLFSKEDLKKLIIPLLFEQALAITVGMADTVMISSAGEAAVSGVSLIDMFNNLIISVLAALATGGAVVTSQFLGAGKKEDACKSAKQLIVSSVCITIGISILVMVFCNSIISLFFGKIEADVFHNAVQAVRHAVGSDLHSSETRDNAYHNDTSQLENTIFNPAGDTYVKNLMDHRPVDVEYFF